MGKLVGYWKYRVFDNNGKTQKGFTTLEDAKKWANKMSKKEKSMFYVHKVLGVYGHYDYNGYVTI